MKVYTVRSLRGVKVRSVKRDRCAMVLTRSGVKRRDAAVTRIDR